MSTTRHRFVLVLGLLFVLALPTNARPVRMWYPDELTQKADLIVIATIKSTAESDPMDSVKTKADTWVPIKSIFDVQAVLKGILSGKTVIVEHYRYFNKSAGMSVIDGPEFVEFNPAKKNQYIIYLKKKGTGTSYEPLSGQEDPGLSFYWLQPYDPNRERS